MEYNVHLFNSLKKISDKYLELSNILANTSNLSVSQITDLNKQVKHTQPIYEKFLVYKKLIDNSINNEKIIETESDREFVELAKQDLEEIKLQIPEIEQELKILLLPVDENNKKNVIVEMRPAAGGDEASIFVADMFDLYKRYADNMNWKIKILDISTNAVGYDYIFFSISGTDVYSKMKFESGVHRVQRVPATESKGRTHTSTITVAVLPEMDKISVKINPADLRIDTYRASGAGGQHVNRTESAVRITHIPTGVVVSCQEGKSQIENRETCFKMLYSKLWQKQTEEQENKISGLRKSQVGTGDRSEKIRTYNYPQNRITDHRIGLSLNKLDQIMANGSLNEIIDPLCTDEQTRLMNDLKF